MADSTWPISTDSSSKRHILSMWISRLNLWTGTCRNYQKRQSVPLLIFSDDTASVEGKMGTDQADQADQADEADEAEKKRMQQPWHKS